MKRTVARGVWGTIEWAFDSAGRMPVRDDFYSSIIASFQGRFMRLFQLLADEGRIRSREHFRQIEHRGRRFWEFKNFQERIFGDYRPGHRFVIAHHPAPKKRDRANPEELERALRALEENDAFEAKQGKMG